MRNELAEIEVVPLPLVAMAPPKTALFPAKRQRSIVSVPLDAIAPPLAEKDDGSQLEMSTYLRVRLPSFRIAPPSPPLPPPRVNKTPSIRTVAPEAMWKMRGLLLPSRVSCPCPWMSRFFPTSRTEKTKAIPVAERHATPPPYVLLSRTA